MGARERRDPHREFSPETFEAQWTRGSTGPEVGAYQGPREAQRRGADLLVPCKVTECVPNELFEFSVGTDDVTVNNWGYRLQAQNGGTLVTGTSARAGALPARLLAGARVPARAHQREGHADHARADEAGGGVMTETMSETVSTNREAMLAKLACSTPSRPRRSPAAARSTSGATTPAASCCPRGGSSCSSTRIGLPRALPRSPAGDRTSPSAPASSPASGSSRASSA